jgi:hypothetical protein
MRGQIKGERWGQLGLTRPARATELDINTEWVSFMTYGSIRDPINPPARDPGKVMKLGRDLRCRNCRDVPGGSEGGGRDDGSSHTHRRLPRGTSAR